MDYPSGFPKHLQPAVDAAVHAAEIEFLSLKKVAGKSFYGSTLREAIRAWVKSIFLAFADQACEAGVEGIWDGPQLRKVIDDYLYRLAYLAETQKDPSGAGGSDHYSHSFAALTVKTIKESDEWIELQQKLKEVAESRRAVPASVLMPTITSAAERLARFYRAAKPDKAIQELANEKDGGEVENLASNETTDAQSVSGVAEPSVASQIESLMNECEMTQQELADKIGTEASTVWRHISGEMNPRTKALREYNALFSKLLKRKVVIRGNASKRK